MSVIQVVGTSYKQCSIEARERLSAAGRPLPELLAEAREVLQARECVLLRTCNRVELYFLGPRADLSLARTLLCGAREATEEEGLYQASDLEAVEHLFAVAAGLDSMVLGEHEIVGQVREAAAAARAAGFAGPILSRLFDHALRAGRRARRETAISSGIFSLGQGAARAAQEVLGCLRGRRVLVFGAGRMAKVAAQHLVATGAGPLSIFSRSYARAEELAAVLGGAAIAAEAVPAALRACDVLVGCTTAPHHVVTAEQLREAVLDREARPLVVIDLGVPRNVDPAASTLPGVHLFNVDQLERVVASHVGEREREIARVQGIVGEEVEAFQQWVEGTRVSAVITQLRARAEEARQACLEVAGRQFSGEELAAVDYALDLLVRKLLHLPIAAIREAAAESEADPDLVSAARRLFGLAAEEAGPSAAPAGVVGERGEGNAPLAR